jgi:hypothetical protein
VPLERERLTSPESTDPPRDGFVQSSVSPTAFVAIKPRMYVSISE